MAIVVGAGGDPPDPGQDPETDRLIAMRARHDPAAFAPLCGRYVDDVYRFCAMRLGTREAAEDATSHTFFRALDRLDGYRGGSFRAWLFTIAHRTTIDAIRSYRPVWPLEHADIVPCAGPTPEDAALAGDEQRWLLSLLGRLPPAQRQVVTLRLAGLNDREIADVLGERHTAVRTRQSRALARLRELARETGWLPGEEEPR